MSKYGNHKTTVDGIIFDSQKEANRYCELKLLQKAGEITELELQKEFVLIPNQYRDGKLVERKCAYKADFYYFDFRSGKYVCEDVKGMRTKEYILKRKMMLYMWQIRITEI